MSTAERQTANVTVRRQATRIRHDKLPAQLLVRTPAFVLALLAGALIRAAALPLPGTEDVGSWKIWAYAASHRVTTVYGVGGSPTIRGRVRWGTRQATVDCPPAALYELGVVGSIYRAIAPDFPDGTRLVVLLKIPGLLCGAALTFLLYRVTALRTRRRDLAQWAALACWLNPALILNGDALGYLDAWMMLPALLSLALVHAGAFFAAGAFVSVALLTTPQGLLVLPALLLAAASLRGASGVLRVVAGGVAAATALVLPFALAGAVPNLRLVLGAVYPQRDVLPADAANLWWIVNWALRFRPLISEMGARAALRVPVPRIMALPRLRELGLLNPRPIAAALIALVVGRACWQTRHGTSLALHAALAAFTVHAFLVLTGGAHAHHQALAVPLLALAAALRPAFRALFYAVTTIVTLNLNLFYGIGRGMGFAIPRTITGIDITVLLSVVNVIVLLWFAAKLGDEAFIERQQGQYTKYEAARQA